MRKHQKKDRAPNHRNRHDHQHNPLEEQELSGPSSLPTLDINNPVYHSGLDVPRSPIFPDNQDFNNEDGQSSGHHVPEALERGPSEHGYVYNRETGSDQTQGIDSDDEDSSTFPYPTHAAAGYDVGDEGDNDAANFDYDTHEAIARSLNERYQPQDANQPSTSTLPNRFNSYQSGFAEASYDGQAEYEQSQTPRPQHLSPNYLADYGNRGQTTDNKFAIVHSTRFRLGMVFKVNWFEPRGAPRAAESEVTEGAAGDPYFSGVRRFIVVKEARGHSLCVGIYTYGKQGCLKRGVHPEHHAQAYDEREQLQYLLDGEPQLGFEPFPITILPEFPWETIDMRSRINLAKLHTINHNVPISIIGSVAPNYLQYLRHSINAVFRNQDVPRHHGSKGKEKGKGKERKR